MGKFYDLPQIKDVLKKLQPIQDIEEGFVAYSEGKAMIPLRWFFHDSGIDVLQPISKRMGLMSLCTVR